MNEVSFALTVGIIASLLSVFISLFISAIWRNIIIPWYEEHLYKGAEISGEWTTDVTYNDGSKNKLIITIKRVGYTVKGSAYCVAGVSKGMHWNLRGFFSNLLLTMTYHSKNNENLDQGSMSLMLINNGKLLKGYIAYYQSDTNSIEAAKFELIPVVKASSIEYKE